MKSMDFIGFPYTIDNKASELAGWTYIRKGKKENRVGYASKNRGFQPYKPCTSLVKSV